MFLFFLGQDVDRPIIMNPYAIPNQPLFPLQAHVSRMLFKNKAFVKKVVEDNIGQEDTKHLMLYLCYENERFSAELLAELLWQVSKSDDCVFE